MANSNLSCSRVTFSFRHARSTVARHWTERFQTRKRLSLTSYLVDCQHRQRQSRDTSTRVRSLHGGNNDFNQLFGFTAIYCCWKQFFRLTTSRSTCRGACVCASITGTHVRHGTCVNRMSACTSIVGTCVRACDTRHWLWQFLSYFSILQ